MIVVEVVVAVANLVAILVTADIDAPNKLRRVMRIW